jgi:hypothetical protein
MRSPFRLIGLIAVSLVVLNGCGGADSVSGNETVSGFIFMDATGSRICGLMLESYPPQCGEPSLKLLDLEPESVVALTSPEDPTLASVSWTDYATSVQGERGPNGLSGVTLANPVYVSGSEGLVLRVTDLGIKAGEPITWPFDLTNRTDANATLAFSDGQRLEVTLSKASGEVYRWSDAMFFTQAVTRLDLAAGTTIPYVLRADAIDLPPGEYTAKAWVTAAQASDAVLTWALSITN